VSLLIGFLLLFFVGRGPRRLNVFLFADAASSTSTSTDDGSRNSFSFSFSRLISFLAFERLLPH
jgi:amino acid transporter